jgi:hypothetical protein
MTPTQQRNAADYAESHGFDTITTPDGIKIFVPAVLRDGTDTVEEFSCRTFGDVRAALGY